MSPRSAEGMVSHHTTQVRSCHPLSVHFSQNDIVTPTATYMETCCCSLLTLLILQCIEKIRIRILLAGQEGMLLRSVNARNPGVLRLTPITDITTSVVGTAHATCPRPSSWPARHAGYIVLLSARWRGPTAFVRSPSPRHCLANHQQRCAERHGATGRCCGWRWHTCAPPLNA
jgi:hypothetical protein